MERARLRNRIQEQLDEVIDPCSEAAGTGLSIVEMGLVDTIKIEDGSVTVRMQLTKPVCMMVSYFITEIEKRVEPLDGVEDVTVDTKSGLWSPSMMTDEAREKRTKRSRDLARPDWSPDRDPPAVAENSD